VRRFCCSGDFLISRKWDDDDGTKVCFGPF